MNLINGEIWGLWEIMGQYPFLSVFLNLLEKLTYNRLLSFSEAQREFRKNRSTEGAIQSFLASTQEAIGKKENQVGIFCDLTKAYDAINNDTSLSKL
jgi:hypothetical protein